MIRLGTRGSALALAQAGWVAERLEGEVELVPIRTSGDERPAGTAPDHSDKARFVKEIEEALLAGRVNLAVHSAKDVPGELPEGLSIVGVPERADARDALCGATSLLDLAEGAVVGTGSLRRRAQLLARRPDLEVVELRGNVDTRLRRVSEGRPAAALLAQAGLDRLGRGHEGSPLPLADFVPAAGQGALALEARTGDRSPAERAAAITDGPALASLTAERALVSALGATCHTPVGTYAEARGGSLRVISFVGMPDGSHWISDELEGDQADPAALGRAVADRLLAAGAAELLREAHALTAPPG